MNTNSHEYLFQLVRLGIGTSKGLNISNRIDWISLKGLADAQGLSAIVLDALNSESANLTEKMPLQMKLEWIGEVLKNYEQRYAQYEKAIGSLADFYNRHGYKMMVLKGYACSLDWPKPNHRPCGDIDIWLFGQQKEADATLSSYTGIKIDGSHHHHTVFEWDGFTVENHYDFVNVHAHKSSQKLEPIFKELGKNKSYSIKIRGEKVYLPSQNLHALFLIRHLANHFASAEINLRQVLDWAFYIEKHTNDIDWEWLVDILEKYHMKDFYNCINAICVWDLGFDVKIFPNVQFTPTLKDRVLKDIMESKYGDGMPKGLICRIAYKLHRWKANEWKQELCYGESRKAEFWTGVKAHLLKPSSI